MGILDNFKNYKEELNLTKMELEKSSSTIKDLKTQFEYQEELLRYANETNSNLHKEIKKYKTLLNDEHYQALEINDYLWHLKIAEIISILSAYKAKKQIKELADKIESLKKEIVILDDEILYQSFGLYKPLYDFINSSQYKEQLEVIREQQKEMIKNKTAVTVYISWTVNGSKSQGSKMTNDNIKQVLRCFNIECENAIDRVKFNNFESIKSRILRSFVSLNILNTINRISITQDYLDLKFKELSLAYEYQLKKQDEKEELKILREQHREEAKLAKEIEEKRKEIEKEQQHYNNALKKVNEQIEFEKSEIRLQYLLEKKKEIEERFFKLDEALKEIDYREANQRAGYVYIISNIGSFGDNIFKIGMTRRLDPQDRIDELSNASVPFKYDIHAMIFSNDAPKLESALHKAFEKSKLNLMNDRKEFFHVTIKEIEEVVKLNHDRTIDFLYTPPAQQYRESSLKYNQINKL